MYKLNDVQFDFKTELKNKIFF